MSPQEMQKRSAAKRWSKLTPEERRAAMQALAARSPVTKKRKALDT